MAISNDYLIYLQKRKIDVCEDTDLNTFSQAIYSPNSPKWINVMKDELALMHKNYVQILVKLPIGCKPIECKQVFKIKWDAHGEIERYKAILVINGYTQKEGIEYKEIFYQIQLKAYSKLLWQLQLVLTQNYIRWMLKLLS